MSACNLVADRDIYVNLELGNETAALLGGKTQMWITNEHQHSGLRDDGETILDRLIKMTTGELHLPP